ncbi:MAG: carboxylesterase/lipase family protein [Hyphomonadaceae bacterium]|nr:carboxylesterase/lipase family protein [Hyphomonadaceae bacterium]
MHLGSIARKRRTVAVLLLMSALLGLSPHGLAQTTPIVKTEGGDIQGVAERNVLAFKGIPFAAPPVGELRWRAPKPADPWPGVRRGDAFARGCIATPSVTADAGGDSGPHSEDCLYLNVWTPKADSAAKLPVMVWIHGGAYLFGSGAVTIYNGAPLASKGAVVVTLNYRLMQLGFFAHPALEADSPGGPANFGLLDQIAALTWVQQNIARFGGDPGNVTIFGQSAGAKSVLALFASPPARGLFHKGIALSSYVVPDAPRTKALEVGTKVAVALGLDGANATAAQLRAVPAARFGEIKGQGLSNAPVPISGDVVLPQSIQAAFTAGRQARLPLIVGSTSDDSSVAAAFGIDAVALLKRLGAAGFLVRALYPGAKDDTELARQATRDLVFTMPARWIADHHAKRAPTWRYYFDYSAVKTRRTFANGVPHGAEVPYVLNTVDIFEGTKKIATAEDLEFARSTSDYLFEFARTGKPAAGDSPAWPSHRARQDRTLILGETIEARSNFMRARLNIFLGAGRVLDRVLGRR